MILEAAAIAAVIAWPTTDCVDVDTDGVLRWKDTQDEVVLFGVNYYPPHYSNYKDLKALEVPIRETIDRDLSHFVRMGLDAFRLHVFDQEISTRDGTLLELEDLGLSRPPRCTPCHRDRADCR